ncbi:hypothetical protein ACGYJ8_17155 [Sulfitobacter sp. 1A12126]|uniref:hypothetical protein n=1 Tax=Sulfitobacter sp. 1A12126 TaxID=3368591 RepID=UPI0037476B39
MVTLANFDVHPLQVEQSRADFPGLLYIVKKYGRDFVFFLIASCIVVFLAKSRSLSFRKANIAGFSALFLFQFLICLKVFAAGAAERAIFIVIFSTSIMFLFAVLLNRRHRVSDFNMHDVLIIGAVANFATVAVNGLVLFLNVDAAFRGSGRFMGMSANPQNLSYFLAITCIFPLAFARIARGRILQALCIASVVGAIVIILSTGSRGPLGLVFISIIFVFFGIWRSRFASPLSALIVLITPLVVSSLGDDLLGERGNTRAYVWAYQVSEFVENPILGQPATGDRIEFGENSWLGSASKLGLVGVTFLFGFVYSSYPRNSSRILELEFEVAAARVAYWGIMFASMFEGLIAGFTNGAIFLLIFMLLANGARGYNALHRGCVAASENAPMHYNFARTNARKK